MDDEADIEAFKDYTLEDATPAEAPKKETPPVEEEAPAGKTKKFINILNFYLIKM